MKKLCLFMFTLIFVCFAMVEVLSVMSIVSSYQKEQQLNQEFKEYRALQSRYKNMKLEDYRIAKEVVAEYASLGADLHLVLSQIQVETAQTWSPTIQSHCGATGLMQIMPQTAQWLGVKDVTDKRENIRGGVRYYCLYCLPAAHYNKVEALKRYNAGHCWRYAEFPDESNNYAKLCLTNYQKTKILLESI